MSASVFHIDSLGWIPSAIIRKPIIAYDAPSSLPFGVGKMMMKTRTIALTGVLVAAFALVPLTFPSAAAVAPVTDTISLEADADTGLWTLTVPVGLDCNLVSKGGLLSAASEGLSFSAVCFLDGKTCTKVGALTEARKRAYAEADSSCDSISAYCESNAPGSGDSDSCEDEDTGNSALPWNCDLTADATWWQAGSYAYAACTVTYQESSA